MIKEHDIVVITEDVADEGATAGDVGLSCTSTTMRRLRGRVCDPLAGQTIAVVSLLAQQVHPVSSVCEWPSA